MADFKAFTEAFHAHFSRNPNRRVTLGVERDLGDLPDPSQTEIDARLAEAKDLLGELPAADSFDEQLDMELAGLMLEAEIHSDSYRFNDRTRLAQMPTAGDDIGNGIFMLFVNDPRPDAARLEDITTRLEQVADYVPALLARLDTPVARWVSMDVEKVSGLGQLFDTAEAWAERVGFADRKRLKAARTRAEGALEDVVPHQATHHAALLQQHRAEDPRFALVDDSHHDGHYDPLRVPCLARRGVSGPPRTPHVRGGATARWDARERWRPAKATARAPRRAQAPRS